MGGRKQLSRSGPSLVLAATVVAAAAVLEALTRGGLIRPAVLVPPSAMLAELWRLLAGGTLWPHIGRTLWEVVAAIALAFPAGLGIGLLLWRFPSLGQAAEPFLMGIYAVPLILLYPFMLVLLGLGAAPVVVIAAAMGTVPVAINVWIGLRELRPIYLRVARSVQAGRWVTLTRVIMPGAAPLWFAGAKLGFIYAFIGVVSSEFITATEGLGFLVSYDYNAFSTARMFAEMLLVVAIAALFNAGLLALERRFFAE